MTLEIEDVARVCHEVNRALCAAFGDMSQVPWEEAPEWQRDSAIAGVKMHWEHDIPPSASHDAWMQHKEAEGWTFGVEKDEVAKTHPCMRPFGTLPPEQQAKDFVFRAVVHALRPDGKEIVGKDLEDTLRGFFRRAPGQSVSVLLRVNDEGRIVMKLGSLPNAPEFVVFGNNVCGASQKPCQRVNVSGFDTFGPMRGEA